MKVLVVTSGNSKAVSPFIEDQVTALQNLGHEFDYFRIQGKGALGYLSNYSSFIKKIDSYEPQIIHAHYGLSGLFAGLQRKKPLIVTYHGSDINVWWNRIFSKMAMRLAKNSIFVSKKMSKTCPNGRFSVIPCGVDLEIFKPIDKSHARRIMNWDSKKKLVLFSSSFDNKVKNYNLLKLAKSLSKYSNEINIIELKGFNRKEVSYLMNACDVAVLTSFMEGSPQFIKEAMACNLPIVSTKVGDVEEIISGCDGCFLTSFDEKELAHLMDKAFDFNNRTMGREAIRHLDSEKIAGEISSLYFKTIEHDLQS